MAKRKVRKLTPEERRDRRRKIKRDWQKTASADDVQQALVYKWQEEGLHLGNACDWTLLECERFIAYVWHAYFGGNAIPPKVNPGRGQMSASAQGRWKITLPVWARNRNTILHELGHSILDAVGCHQAHHGPLFARMEVELLNEFSTYGRNGLLRTAREMGVKVARRSEVPRRQACAKTLAECRTKHYHSIGNSYGDWMKKGSPRIVHVAGRTYREQR